MAKLAVFVIGDASSAKAAMAETGVAAEGMAGKVEAAGKAMSGAFMGAVKAFLPLVAAFEAGKFLKGAIDSAEELKKAQDSLAVSIEHTGGSVAKLQPQYEATAKAAAQYGVDVVAATQGLARATLLTGSAVKAQRAYREALVISKATGKDFNAVLTATSKGQVGITTSLRRYGILIDSTATGQEQLTQVMKRFGGQAEANTSAADQLSANFENLQTTIGTKLLPVFNKIVEGINYVVTWLASPAVSSAVHRFIDAFMNGIQPAIDFVKTQWPQIKVIILGVFDIIKTAVLGYVAFFKAIWDHFGSTIIALTKIAWNFIKGAVQNGLEAIRGIIDIITGLIHGDWSQVWKGIKETVSGTLGLIGNILRLAVSTLGAIATRIGFAIWNGLKAGAVAFIGWVGRQIQWLIDKIDEITGKLDRSGARAFAQKIAGGGGGGGGNGGAPVGPAGPGGAPGGARRGSFGSSINPGANPGASVVVNVGTVHGSADAAFAKTLASELATQLRGGRVPEFQQAIQAT